MQLTEEDALENQINLLVFMCTCVLIQTYCPYPSLPAVRKSSVLPIARNKFCKMTKNQDP